LYDGTLQVTSFFSKVFFSRTLPHFGGTIFLLRSEAHTSHLPLQSFEQVASSAALQAPQASQFPQQP
jgi:hypothetical protein